MSEPTGPATTRRAVITRAGIATAVGLAATAIPAGAATATTTTAGPGVARGAPGMTAVEFRGRISQSGPTGESFSSNGFLTSVRGLLPSALFSGGPPSIDTALFTAHAQGQLTARVLDRSVHALDIVGTMSVHRRRTPGADWADDSSFTSGLLLAEYAVTLQDVLAVFAPGQGLPTLTGEMRQTYAGTVRGRPTDAPFGGPGLLLRMCATGLGTLVNPVTLNAELEIAGSWVVP